jgi:hypothetical protein
MATKTQELIESIGNLKSAELAKLIEKREKEDKALKALYVAARSRERKQAEGLPSKVVRK